MSKKITLDSGETCDVIHEFRADRLIVDYDGLFILVDLVLGAWVMSGHPATAEEKPVLNSLVAGRPDSLKMIKD